MVKLTLLLLLAPLDSYYEILHKQIRCYGLIFLYLNNRINKIIKPK